MTIAAKHLGPDFLVVGAMKSGTTTLAFDLDSSRSISFPAGKEVELLASSKFATDEALIEAYFSLLGPNDGRLIGDASPHYMMGDSALTASRAKAFLKSELKLICILRNPIERAISHYKHMWRWVGHEFESIDDAFNDPLFLDTSRYAQKLSPWVEQFGRDRICILKFEDYVINRTDQLSRVLEFLSVSDVSVAVDESTALNTSNDRYMLNPLASRLRGALRRFGVHKPVPKKFKERLLPLFAGDAPKLDANPSERTLNLLVGAFKEDSEKLRVLLGEDAPTWDLDSTAARISERRC